MELDDECVALDCEDTLESDLTSVADIVAEPPVVRLPWNVSGERKNQCVCTPLHCRKLTVRLQV